MPGTAPGLATHRWRCRPSLLPCSRVLSWRVDQLAPVPVGSPPSQWPATGTPLRVAAEHAMLSRSGVSNRYDLPGKSRGRCGWSRSGEARLERARDDEPNPDVLPLSMSDPLCSGTTCSLVHSISMRDRRRGQRQRSHCQIGCEWRRVGLHGPRSRRCSTEPAGGAPPR